MEWFLECLIKEGNASVPKSSNAFLFFGIPKFGDFPPLPGEMTDKWKQSFDDNQVNIWL
jgi:hypothetical protein